ncbi:MAG: hypothetical protein NTW86_27685 [Candidatus Sumerlaeota bacterium]|nr:hypothetical protein [Candidatus Sumerlaeota bacterium]
MFLCTGDTCRGPMAAGFVRKLLEDAEVGATYEVKSAGVMTVSGLVATPESKQMADSVGVSLDRHRSTPMTAELLRKADLILGMTPLHVQLALRMEPSIRPKVHLLKEFTRSDLKKVQIDDPMGNTLEIYKKVFREIKNCCLRVMKMPFITGEPEPPAERASRASRSSRRRTPKAKPAAKAKAPKSGGKKVEKPAKAAPPSIPKRSGAKPAPQAPKKSGAPAAAGKQGPQRPRVRAH